MARRKATPQDRAESRFIASRIQDARRRGATNRQIAEAFGMNERTVRKIVAGETPGTRIYKSKIEAPRPKASPSIVRIDIQIGEESNGDPVIRTINAKVPALPTAKGVRAAPTPFDVFRLPNLEAVAVAEGQRMQRNYGMLGARYVEPRISTIRPIARRNPKTVLYTITGMER